MPPAVSVPGSGGGDLLLDPGTGGPRRDRTRGKKHGTPKKPPTGQTRKNETTSAGGRIIAPNDPGIGTGNPDDTNVTTDTRICNLEDVADGQWVYSETQGQSPEWGPNQDMSWTGYGHNSCRSTIWNERYLLTPTVANDTTSKHRSTSILQNDWDYAHHLQNFLWQPAQKQRQSQEGSCRQPEMDVEDFVEVLKRAPLVMIGDKFLEQEYLTIECFVLGMQGQLVYDYRLENNKKSVDEKTMKGALEYWIESETPPVVEFKVAPQSVAKTEGTSPSGKNRPAVYRKAKPGQMRLVDRVSNLTLVTFIRSDVLWDSEMLTRQTSKHTLKSILQPSNLDAASGLHPDCKLAGTVLLCEPARIDFAHDSGLEGYKSTKQSTSKHWWQWWIGADDNTEAGQLQSEDVEDSEEDMSFGSDFDHDMINLEWVQSLQDIVQDAANHQSKEGTATVERKPVVMISNGHFWEYDPQDAAALFSITKGESGKMKKRALSKVEQDQLRESQIKRRKLLRQRYTMVVTNMLDYIKATYPDLRVMVQTSVRCNTCGAAANTKAPGGVESQEAALLNALTKTVVARMQDPLYSFLDTTFLRLFRDSVANKRHCNNFMMPGPLDTLVHHLYGELFRLDL
ncbi:hypothetical protein BGX26_007185 [Mortierella sp. AD094]|nr:hypothetical protein BGX26_007185 [Mortierella sp. AD094]